MVALTGAILLVDPLFLLVYWHNEASPKGFGIFFQSAHYPELFFLWLDITLLYFSFSGARIWIRIDYGGAEHIHSNIFDWFLTSVMGIFSIIFLVIGIYDFMLADHMAILFTVGSGLALTFVGFDFYTFFKKPFVKSFPWWIIHMTKMFLVWAALIDAFWLRVRVYILPEEYINYHIPFGTLLWLTFSYIGFMAYRKYFPKPFIN